MYHTLRFRSICLKWGNLIWTTCKCGWNVIGWSLSVVEDSMPICISGVCSGNPDLAKLFCFLKQSYIATVQWIVTYCRIMLSVYAIHSIRLKLNVLMQNISSQPCVLFSQWIMVSYFTLPTNISAAVVGNLQVGRGWDLRTVECDQGLSECGYYLYFGLSALHVCWLIK